MHIQKLSTERSHTSGNPLRIEKSRNSLQMGGNTLGELLKTESESAKKSGEVKFFKLRDKRSLAAKVREAKTLAAQTLET